MTLPPQEMSLRRITLAITGASGTVLAQKALQLLVADARVGEVNLVPSAHAVRVASEEMSLAVGSLKDFATHLLGATHAKVRVHDNRDIGATIASGSYPIDAMVIVPCSMGTLASVAHGLADNLVERAADVCLKERRPLVLAVREAPLNRIHLQNMLTAHDAGAIIFPVIPAFYDGAQSGEQSATQFVCRLLAQIGLPQAQAFQWPG